MLINKVEELLWRQLSCLSFRFCDFDMWAFGEHFFFWIQRPASDPLFIRHLQRSVRISFTSSVLLSASWFQFLTLSGIWRPNTSLITFGSRRDFFKERYVNEFCLVCVLVLISNWNPFVGSNFQSPDVQHANQHLVERFLLLIFAANLGDMDLHWPHVHLYRPVCPYLRPKCSRKHRNVGDLAQPEIKNNFLHSCKTQYSYPCMCSIVAISLKTWN